MQSQMAWSIRCLADGVYPDRRHAWQASDGWRSSKAGQKMAAPMCCLYFKGDWAEFSHTLSLATWRDAMRPCFACMAYGDDLFNPVGCSSSELRWYCSTADDYDAECSRCEKHIPISSIADRSLILRNLEYDSRQTGSHGRCLTADIQELGLVRGDRLEPSAVCRDVGRFEDFPIGEVATFWRKYEESLARHRNPVFMQDMGLGIDRCLSYDVLHCVHLGVLNCFCAVCLWQIIDSGVFGTAHTNDSLIHIVNVIRNRLMQLYKDYRHENPASNLTQVDDLTVGMISPRESNAITTKGAETFGFSSSYCLFSICTRLPFLHTIACREPVLL